MDLFLSACSSRAARLCPSVGQTGKFKTVRSVVVGRETAIKKKGGNVFPEITSLPPDLSRPPRGKKNERFQVHALGSRLSAVQGQLGGEEGRHVDTANHIRRFDLAGLNPEGTGRIDAKEFTVSHAAGKPAANPGPGGRTTHMGGSPTYRLRAALGFEDCGNIRSGGADPLSNI